MQVGVNDLGAFSIPYFWTIDLFSVWAAMRPRSRHFPAAIQQIHQPEHLP